MLSFDEYKQAVKALPFGKKVGRSVYVLYDDLVIVSPVLGKILQYLGKIEDTTIIKFFLDQFKVSLLQYPSFFVEPHPSLAESETIDLATGKKRKINYTKQANPPILHRKETMISPKREVYAQWQSLTVDLEKAGMFEESNKIGFKDYWNALLSEKGLSYAGHRLVQSDFQNNPCKIKDNPAQEVEIARHKTAMNRSDFSKPVQLLLKHNLLVKNQSFFDYGCGHGDDIRGLDHNGFTATGWDPVLKPDGNLIPADVVNLGFVLNVIENPTERIEALTKAFSLSKRILSVAVVTDASPTAKNIRPYKDGFLTSRGTFQKYYRHEEAQEWIESTLNHAAWPVYPGIFFVFKEEQDAQDFLASRYQHRTNWTELNRNVFPSRDERDAAKKELLLQNYHEQIQSYWDAILELGRIPTDKEFPEGKDVCESIGISDKQLYAWFIERYGTEVIERANRERYNNLMVYLGLSNFKRNVPFSSLSPRLQRDIKSFFGSYQAGLQVALQELYKIGNPDEIEKRCNSYYNKTEEGRLDDQALYLPWEMIQHLDPVLRMYVGVAELLFGDISEVDEVKIHKSSGKVTFFIYSSDDLQEGEYIRVKVSLREQKVFVFRHRL